MKIFLLITSLLVLLVVLGFFLKPLAINYLEDRLKTELEKVEHLSTGELQISIAAREVTLVNAKYESPKEGLKLEIKKIELDGFSLYQLLIKKQLEIDNVRITSPVYSQYDHENNEKESKSSRKKNKLKQLSIKNIEILNGSAQVFNKDSALIHEANKISSEFKGLSIDLRKEISIAQLEYTNFNISLDSAFLFQHSKHYLSSKKVLINSIDGISINKLRYYPNDKYKNGNKKVDYRVNWTDATIDSLHIILDWDLLKNSNQIHATAIRINQLEYSSLIDKNYPRKEIVEKPLPHQMIKQLNIPITVDTMLLVNSRFQYNEIKEGRDKKGIIYFTEFNASIENITNDSLSLANNTEMKANIKTKLMDQSVMNVTINYDLSSVEGHHRISGNLANFDLTKLNQVFMPLALIRFETGYLNNLDFNFYLNSTVSEGNLDFHYEDLKVIVYNDGEDFKPEIVGKVVSGIANGLIIRKSNPLRGNYIKGEIAFEREKEKSFLTFWWKSLFSGMKSTVMRNE